MDEIGQRLVAVSPDAGEEYHFFVIDETSVNALAMPDGYIFIHRGLIAYCRSEDELAGVIGAWAARAPLGSLSWRSTRPMNSPPHSRAVSG